MLRSTVCCSSALMSLVRLPYMQEPEPQPTAKAKKKRVAAPLDVSPLPQPSAAGRAQLKKAAKLVQF